MKVIKKDIEEIIPYANNPRNNDRAVAAVACSISEFGFKVPCVIDKKNILVTGHTRLLAAKKLGMTKVPCVIADDLTDAQIKAYRLADNRVAELAEWDKDLLAMELQQLAALDIKMDGFGFDADEMNSLETVSEDELPEIDEEEPKTKPGQIFKLGEHRLMCGDSTSADDVKKLCGGQKIDLLLTDPPYNVNYEGGTGMTIQNDNMADSAFLDFLTKAYKAADGVMKPGAAFYIWNASLELFNFLGALKNINGWGFKSLLIWVKNTLIMGRQDYQWKHEPCIYGWKEGAAHYFCDRRNESTVIEDKPDLSKMSKEQLKDLCARLLEPKVETTVLYESKPTKNDIHPTMKPVKLFARIMLNSSRAGENILDLFGGSGTTIIAAEQLKRKAHVMELDPKYCDAIIARWEKLTGQTAEVVE